MNAVETLPVKVEGSMILACGENTPLETLEGISVAVDVELKRAKANAKVRDDVFCAVIHKHGPFRLGGKLWRLAKRSKLKCKGWLKTFTAIAESCGGDESAIDAVMKDDGFYITEARSRLGDRFNEFFETVPVSKLDPVDNPSDRQLQGIPIHMLR